MLVLQPEIVTCLAGTERILVLLGAAMGGLVGAFGRFGWASRRG
jgi:hypothetical protein